MNKQNFTAQDRFPLSTQALDFMQEMIMLVSKMGALGGDNYILSGCEEVGSNVSDGIIVLNGEVLQFRGGIRTATFTIVEESVPVVANGITFENARIVRYCKFASGTGANYYSWSSLKRIKTNQQLESEKASTEYVDTEIGKISGDNIPSGVIVMWSGEANTVPETWELCDGIRRPDGFTPPDLRGKFIVGLSPNDADFNTVGKTGGEKKVTLSLNQIPQHTHMYTDDTYAEGAYPELQTDFPIKASPNAKSISTSGSKSSGYAFNTSKTGGSQSHNNLPPYFTLAFIIKR